MRTKITPKKRYTAGEIRECLSSYGLVEDNEYLATAPGMLPSKSPLQHLEDALNDGRTPTHYRIMPRSCDDGAVPQHYGVF